MSVPQRPFRASTPWDEMQHVPVGRALDSAIGSDQVGYRAVRPFGASVTTGGGMATLPVHIDWSFVTFSASKTAAGSTSATVLHGLGRQPSGAFMQMGSHTVTNLALFVVSVSNWNQTSLVFGVNFGAVGGGTVTGSAVIF